MKNVKSPRRFSFLTVVALTAALSFTAVAAIVYGGAIQTSDRFGTPVNQNIYNFKSDVYLNGGPNHSNNSGLPADTTFYFQVTDPSGKELLSSKPAICRQVLTNSEGRIVGPVAVTAVGFEGCEHSAGEFDFSNSSTGVQLAPYANTPNIGGVYKVWLVPIADAEVGEDGKSLSFKNSDAKTDNYKVVSIYD